MVSEAHPRKHREAVPGLVSNLGGPNQALGATARGCLISFVPHEMRYPRYSMQFLESKGFVARVSLRRTRDQAAVPWNVVVSTHLVARGKRSAPAKASRSGAGVGE
ncbi:hypothetical protein BV504_04065 [Halomonas sp. 'Soap Lake |nr:hypothetical protein B2G49_04055 [Halomonas sp. 'Soap Lake \